MREDRSLVIDRVSTRDAGTYVCIAQNSAGTAIRQIRLQVQGVLSFSFVSMYIFVISRHLRNSCCHRLSHILTSLLCRYRYAIVLIIVTVIVTDLILLNPFRSIDILLHITRLRPIRRVTLVNFTSWYRDVEVFFIYVVNGTRVGREHLSYDVDDSLEDKRRDCQNCSVLCCVRQLCTMIRTHI